MNYKNAFFQLLHKEDGTYISLYPPQEGGKPLTIEMVTNYLDRKNVKNYDIKKLNSLIYGLNERKVALLTREKVFPQSEALLVQVSEDRMRAVGVFYPPSGSGKLMTKEDIISDLNFVGVKEGIQTRIIDAYLRGRQFCTPIVLAKGTPAREGKNAVITYYFETEVDSKPKLKEDGSVDFHQLDMINHVNAGDVLAELTPADMGEPGKDVTGNAILPHKVVQKRLSYGKNIHLSEDGLTMYSDVSGHVSLVENKVFVSDTYVVPADVGVSSGDISYDGDVEVKGNVVSGFSVQAKGNIVVDGVVEGATLIAGGQIILKRGAQGMGKAFLKAEGDIIAHFLENCEVRTEGNITTDAILHSTIYAKGDISVGGKRGMITGGKVRSCSNIYAKILGSTMGTNTDVELGISESIMEEVQKLDKEAILLKEEMEKLGPVIAVLKKRMAVEAMTDELKNKVLTVNKKYEDIKKKIEQKQERSQMLKDQIANYKGGRVKVMETTYPGVKITISGVSCYIRDDVIHSQFLKDQGDVRIAAL